MSSFRGVLAGPREARPDGDEPGIQRHCAMLDSGSALKKRVPE
jgi:hypothetical protein